MSDKKRSLESADMSDSDDDMPIAEFVKKRLRKEKAIAIKKENSSKSNDNKKPEKSSNKTTKVTTKATKTTKSTKEKNDDHDDEEEEVAAPPTRSKITSTDSAIISSKSMKDYIGRGFYENSLKGKLVQCLLRRWWYAYEWPEPKDIPPVPAGYQALDGFPGVFISTRVSIHTSAYTCIHTYLILYTIYTHSYCIHSMYT